MYYPLLRAKQNELLALRETIGKTVSVNNILPILEPVNQTTRDIQRCSSELTEANSGYILIVNPQVGYFSSNQRRLDELIYSLIQESSNIEFAYRINEGTTIEQIQLFFTKYSEYPNSLIHTSSTKDSTKLVELIKKNSSFNKNFFIKNKVGRKYERSFSEFNNVVIEDNFKKLDRNADYDDEDFFSDSVFNYEEDGYVGFGDYSIVGDSFSKSGGPPITAALHLTYEETNEQEIWIKHFLSEPRSRVEEDGPTLVSEALPKLVDYIQENEELFAFSNTCKELISLHESGERTSLGKMKRLSMKHHFELMNHILNRNI